MRRGIGFGVAMMLVVAACGGESNAGDSTTTMAAERVGGTLYAGTFESGPGYGPGEITLQLDESGNAFSEISYVPALEQFACPNGKTVSGGGWSLDGRMGISGDSFDFSFGLSGVFESATEITGTYNMRDDYDCDRVLNWTATSQGTAVSLSAERVGGTLYVGTFESGQGYGPGEITVQLDETGDVITHISYVTGLDGFACPNGKTVSDVGEWNLELPGGGVAIVDDSFSVSALVGVFDSPTEVSGTYNLQLVHGCDAVLTWSATSHGDPLAGAPATTAASQTTVAAADRLEQDTTLIGEFFAGYNASWLDGVDSGIDWIASHNHPDLGYSRAQVACDYAGVAAGYREEVVIELASVAASDGWVFPTSSDFPSPLDGTVPRGRLYAMQVEYIFRDGGDTTYVPTEAHVAILPGTGGDEVRMFFRSGC